MAHQVKAGLSAIRRWRFVGYANEKLLFQIVLTFCSSIHRAKYYNALRPIRDPLPRRVSQQPNRFDRSVRNLSSSARWLRDLFLPCLPENTLLLNASRNLASPG